MSSSRPSYGINFTKKGTGNKSQPSKRKPLFADDDSDDEKQQNADGVEEIDELEGISSSSKPLKPSKPGSKLPVKGEKPSLKPSSKNVSSSMYGDLASSFTSKKHTATAEELDENIYEYDAVYDSLKPKKATDEDKAKKPSIMGNLMAAAAVRKRDATIAEEKRLARERMAEGDEFADKEKFVTLAYKKQQEENRRIEEEERIKEEAEAKKNMGSGLTSFYKKMLERQEQEHAEVVKAVEAKIKRGPAVEEEEVEEKTAADLAREICEKEGRKIAINDDGEVVDKRDLLKGGLNIIAKPKSTTQAGASRGGPSIANRSRGSGLVGAGGGKQAMRERQSRMMEAQLEQATKRALEKEEEERENLERASKSRKTDGDIMSAKERYLARKREAEEAKKRGQASL